MTLSEGPSDLTKEDAEKIIDATSPATDAGLTVATGGYLGQAVSKADTESSEAVGLTATAGTLCADLRSMDPVSYITATGLIARETGEGPEHALGLCPDFDHRKLYFAWTIG